jgi:hypothetical protein
MHFLLPLLLKPWQDAAKQEKQASALAKKEQRKPKAF